MEVAWALGGVSYLLFLIRTLQTDVSLAGARPYPSVHSCAHTWTLPTSSPIHAHTLTASLAFPWGRATCSIGLGLVGYCGCEYCK